MSDDVEDIDVDALEKRMEGAFNALRGDFASLRTGRAAASMLDPVMVDAYGASMPVNQCATINVPEPRMVVVNVWDKGLVAAVDKAIRNSGLGINPVMDGTLLRLPIPELNEERRRDLAKQAGQYAESARIAVRNVRRDGMDQLKKAKAAGMGEDDQKLWEDEIQTLTDAAIKKIDVALDTKQEEIMQV
ncbi:MAG: ribosome recycling factor [Pseudomonadota bacterium]